MVPGSAHIATNPSIKSSVAAASVDERSASPTMPRFIRQRMAILLGPVDEQVDDVPWDADVDLVGNTCMTALAPRAYEIARHFRERRIPVVLGGMHPTLC